MSTFRYRRAFRDALDATEREAHVIHESRAISSKSAADIQPPEPCNFCAPDDLVPATDRFAELRADLGPYWLVWLIVLSGTCIVSAWLAVRLVAVLVAP